MNTKFHFPQRNSRGYFMGFTLGQIIACAAGIACLVLAFNVAVRGHIVIAIGAALASAIFFALGLIRFRGRRATEWAPLLLAALIQRGTHQDRYRGGPFAPHSIPQHMDLPGPLAGYTWIPAIAPDGRTEIGLLKHTSDNTITAVLACSGQNFLLADSTIQEQRLTDWASTLNLLGAEYYEQGLERWSIMTRAVPDTGNRAQRFLVNRATDNNTTAYNSLAELTASAAPSSQRQEMYFTVVFDIGRLSHHTKTIGDTDEAAATFIIEQLFGIEHAVSDADIKTDGWLSPRTLAGVIRTQFDPEEAALIDIRSTHPDTAGVTPHMAGPIAAENTDWSYYRHDSAYSQTLWIYEMPRIDVPATWMTPLFTQTTCRRAITLTAQPIPPETANLATRREKTIHASDANAKSKLRLLRTAREDEEARGITQIDQEQAAGHVRYQYVLLVTITAPTLEQLKRDVRQVKGKLAAARVDPVVLYGEQDQAFYAGALPLARGLKPMRGLFT